MALPQRVKRSLAEFAARRRQRNKIIFSRDMCVRENTSQAASVEFVRHRRTNYARSRLQSFCRKNPEGFSTVSGKALWPCLFFKLKASALTAPAGIPAKTSASSARCTAPRRTPRRTGTSRTSFPAQTWHRPWRSHWPPCPCAAAPGSVRPG